MSIEKIHLRKLLQLFDADARQQRSLLLRDIGNDRRKAAGADDNSGGDFHVPFWADVKVHVAGHADLNALTAKRIATNKSRARLYPLLTEAFLAMWNEMMRWRNEPFEFVPKSVKARLPFPKLDAIVKIENTVAVKIWDGSFRVVYPYFAEKPSLTEESARLGFWALHKALPNYPLESLRIVDLLRRAYFRPVAMRMKGDEEELFTRKYAAVLKEWRKLRDGRS